MSTSTLLTIDKNASDKCESYVPVEASIVHWLALLRLDWAPGIWVLLKYQGHLFTKMKSTQFLGSKIA